MNTSSARPRKVLAVMDESESQDALLRAAELAERHDAALEVFACVEPPPDLHVFSRLTERDPSSLLDDLRQRMRQDMAERLERHLPGRGPELRLAVGKTFVEVIRHVLETDCDFVVKCAEPLSGFQRFLFSSTDQHLLRKCPCPVWLLTPGANRAPECVLATVDVDDRGASEPETLEALNRRVIDTARHIAAPNEAEVIVLHAWDAVGEGLVWTFSGQEDATAAADTYVNEVFGARHEAMERLLDRCRDHDPVDSGIPLVPRLVRGQPERVIEAQSRELDADVVVMGTVARTGLSGLFIGNTAENIINSLERPVVAVKPDGFVSPLARP